MATLLPSPHSTLAVDHRRNRSGVPPRMVAPLFVATLAIAGCKTDVVHHSLTQLAGVIPREVFDIQVTPVFTETTQGTAIVLGADTFLTCDHVLPKGTELVRLFGEQREIVVLERGRGSEWSDDWALFQTQGDTRLLDRPPTACDFERSLTTGTALFLIGHRGEAVDVTTILPGEVITPPDRWNMPTGVTYAAVELMPERTDEGMSGAAAVVIERDTDRPVVVGLLIGRATVTINGATAGYLRVLAHPRPESWIAPPFDN